MPVARLLTQTKQKQNVEALKVLLAARGVWGYASPTKKKILFLNLEALKYLILHEVFLQKNQSCSTGDYFPNKTYFMFNFELKSTRQVPRLASC